MQNRTEPQTAKQSDALFAAAQPAEVPAGTPHNPITDTPEFREALAKAMAEVLPKLLAEQGGMRDIAGPEKTSPGPADTSWMEALAMSIANLSTQGTGKSKPVDPQVMRAREEARATMLERIRQAHANGLTPSYQLRNKIYIGEQLIEPMFTTSDHIARPTEIDWKGIPNEAMKPTNEVAQGIFDAFMASIGSSEKVIEDSPLYITSGGVVIHGRPPTRRGGMETPAVGSGADNDMVRVKHRDAPGQYVETNILGSIAQPARQTA